MAGINTGTLNPENKWEPSKPIRRIGWKMQNAPTLTTNPDSRTTELNGRDQSSTSLVVETRGLRKVYGNFVALDRMDLAIPRAAVGLLGPNGAGKTTLLKILLGL